MATVAKGEDICLQGDNSDVQLHITAGCPKRAHMMEVRTDLSSFTSMIPDDECFIAPVVDILAPAKTGRSSYVLRIPHCLSEDDDRSQVKVRMFVDNKYPPHNMVDVPLKVKNTDEVLFYEMDSNFIELHTSHFCKVTCTICESELHCLKRATNFIFGKIEASEECGKRQNLVEIRPYFCAIANKEIKDFRVVRYALRIYHYIIVFVV